MGLSGTNCLLPERCRVQVLRPFAAALGSRNMSTVLLAGLAGLITRFDFNLDPPWRGS